MAEEVAKTEVFSGSSVQPKILMEKHPDIEAIAPTWERVRVLIEEDEAAYEKYLNKLPREEPEDLARRKEGYILGFTNPSQELITVPGDYIMRQPIDRQAENKDVQAFIAKADRSEQSLNDFIRNQVSPTLTAYGTVFAVIDKPAIAVQSKSQEREVGMPYICILANQQVLNYRWGADGKLNYFRYWQYAGQDALGPFDEPKGAEKQYVTWTRTKWFLHNEKGDGIGYFEHNFGVVPVIVQASFTLNDNRTLGKSTFFGASRYILMGNNLLSVANYEIAKYGRILMVDSMDWDDTSVTRPVDPGTNKPEVTQKAAETKVMRVNDMQRKPEYLFSNIEIVDKANAQAWKYFDMAAEMQSSGREAKALSGAPANPQSGVSKAYDFQDTNANLFAHAMDLQEFDNAALSIVSKIQRSNKPTSSKFPKSFDVRGFKEKIEQIVSLRKIGYQSKTGLALAYAGLSQELTTDEKVKAAIDAEVKAAVEAETKPKEEAPDSKTGEDPDAKTSEGDDKPGSL